MIKWITVNNARLAFEQAELISHPLQVFINKAFAAEAQLSEYIDLLRTADPNRAKTNRVRRKVIARNLGFILGTDGEAVLQTYNN